MSVSITKTEGVTVLTLTSDPQSALPPICQLLKGLCCSPVCCSVSQHLKKIQGTSQSALGTIQIMTGLLNIGLGAILLSSVAGSTWQMRDTKFPFWLGGLFILFGAISILSEKKPSPCLVILNVLLSALGVVCAIAAIVLYSVDMGDIKVRWACGRYDYDYYGYRRHTMPSPSPEEIMMTQKCLEIKKLTETLLRSINTVLIILSVLQLCVTISSAVLGMKALGCSKKRDNKSPYDLEHHKSLLEEVTSKPAA